MLASLTLALLASTAAAPLEQAASREVLRAYEQIGRQAPRVDPALSRAARRLAGAAVKGRAEDAADLLVLTSAVSTEGAADPSPRALVIRTSPPEETVATLKRRQDVASDPATHVGVGVAVQGDRAALVVLLTQRIATLESFPRTFARAGESKSLCGELASGWKQPELYVTRPSGAVDKLPPNRVQGRRFCALLSFPSEGRHTVELLARGPGGPAVAALFLVDVGQARAREEEARIPEPRTVAEARTQILERVNALRRAHGVAPVAADRALDAVAQAYSERMNREGFFAHVAPDGTDLRKRLNAAKYRFSGAGENLGLAAGPLAAHFGIEHSPGHRQNVLDPAHKVLGIGITEQRIGDRKQVLLTEVFATPSSASSNPQSDAYRRLQALRSAKKLPVLQRNEALERIAIEHARRALAADQAKTELPGSKVHERVFSTLPSVKSAAVEMYIADSADQLPDSAALSDAKNTSVGIGVVRGDSRTHGRDRLWMVVIYASQRR